MTSSNQTLLNGKSQMQVEVVGDVQPGFEAVQDAFVANWQRIEVGASLTVYRGQQKVVDIWGGFKDSAATKSWESDTLVNVYSTTKGLASIAVAILADQAKLDYEAKVTDYWPEFGAAGKDSVTVAQLLSHQAGLCGLPQELTVEDLYDFDSMTQALAAQQPLWELGTGAGYHAITWGYFPGELVRRIAGKTLGEFFSDEVAQPLSADCFIGLPETEFSRVADLIGPNRARVQPDSIESATTPNELYRLALQNPLIRPYKDACSSNWRKAEIAAANGQANARGIATAYVPMANGGKWNGQQLISQSGIAAATQQEVGEEEHDKVLDRPMRKARGFVLNTGGIYGPNENAFGHSGAGGSVGFADPDSNIAFGYAMNQMEPDPKATPRAQLLVDALYSCL